MINHRGEDMTDEQARIDAALEKRVDSVSGAMDEKGKDHEEMDTHGLFRPLRHAGAQCPMELVGGERREEGRHHHLLAGLLPYGRGTDDLRALRF